MSTFLKVVKNTKKSAFSIAELSVVVVASGLLLFAGFKGFDLVKKAKVNSLIKQISETKTAIDVFFDSNGQLPGDISSSNIADFSNINDSTKVIDIQTDFAANRGNSNGNISWGTDLDCSGDSTLSTFVNESTSAWYHLFYGNYINDMSVVASDRTLYSVANTSVNSLPKTKINGLNIVFYGLGGVTPSVSQYLVSNAALSYTANNIIVGGLKTFSTQVGCKPKMSPFVSVLTYAEAEMMDKMIDDGISTSGNVVHCSTSIDDTTQDYSCLSTNNGFSTVSIKINRRS